jgi:predicted Zn finger-like uncharacterized protein
MSEKSSHFIAVCPNCLMTLKINYSYSGNHVRCKHCDHKFRALAPDDLDSNRTSAENPPDPRPQSRSAADRMTMNCPSCASSLSVRRELAGQHVRCKSCNHKFLVPKIVEFPDTPAPASVDEDLFDHLYANVEPANVSAPSSPTSHGSSEVDADAAAIRAQRDELQAELASLREEHSLHKADHDSTTNQLERLQSEYSQLQSALREAQAERERLGSELASVQKALGDVAPGEIADLRIEHDSLRTEHDSLRTERDSLRTERESLRTEHDSLRTERESLRTELDQLRAHPQVSSVEESPPGNLDEATERREGELREAQQQLEQLTKRFQNLEGELSGSLVERAELGERLRELEANLARAGDLHEDLTARLRDHTDELSAKGSELAGLLAARGQAEEQANQLRAELDKRDADLGTTRDQLGSASKERDKLQAEVNALHEVQETLKAERGLAAQRDHDYRKARTQVEQLTQQLQTLEAELNSVRAERAEIDQRVGRLEGELIGARTHHEELTGRLRDHGEVLSAKEDEIAGLLQARTQTADQAGQLQSALAERENELARLRDQLASAQTKHDSLQTRFTALEHLHESLHAEQAEAAVRDRELYEARLQVEQLVEQVRGLEGELGSSRSERAELDRKVREVEVELEGARAEHGHATAKLAGHAQELSAKGDEIIRLQALRTESEDHVKVLHDGLAAGEEELEQLREQFASASAQHAELQAHVAKLDSEGSRNLELLAAAEARAGEHALLVDRLRAEILALAESRSVPDAELEAAQREIADLRRRLNEKETSQQSMSSLLEGMGIRLH